MKYYLLLRGEQAGPYSMDQMRSMWGHGSITSATMYWFEGLSEWIPVGVLIEDAIAEDRRKAATLAALTQRKAEEKTKEKPIGVGENLAIILFSLLLSAIAFVAGIIYCVAGKKNRGVRLMGWSVFWFAVLYGFFFVIGFPSL